MRVETGQKDAHQDDIDPPQPMILRIGPLLGIECRNTEMSEGNWGISGLLRLSSDAAPKARRALWVRHQMRLAEKSMI